MSSDDFYSGTPRAYNKTVARVEARGPSGPHPPQIDQEFLTQQLYKIKVAIGQGQFDRARKVLEQTLAGPIISPISDGSPIEALSLSEHHARILALAGISTVGELTRKTPDDLWGVRGFHQDVLSDVIQALARHGRKLRSMEMHMSEGY